MMEAFVFNMKKYRQKRSLSQMKLAEMLDTSTAYIGEIEIHRKVPSLGMVEKIAKALNVEPFRLFVDGKDRVSGDAPEVGSYLERLTTLERQDLARRIVASVANDVGQILQPENRESAL